MAQINEYEEVLVESYKAIHTSGKHGKVHIRPVAGHKYSPELQVQCSKKLSKYYPLGTKFILQAKLTDREGRVEYLYSSFRWNYEVVD